MLSLLAPKFSRLSTDREEDSTTTLHVRLPVATTFIFTRSLNGESHEPCRASITKRASSHFTAEKGLSNNQS